MSEAVLLLFMVFITLLIVLIGIALWRRLRNRPTAIESGAVLLNSIERVFKLVTVEGNYSEVLQYKEKNRIFFDLIPQEKKALVVVKGKVLMGMDMAKAKFSIEESSQRITLESVPEPEILGLETDVEYYDMSSSMLKRFKADELTRLQEKAKELIRQEAIEGDLHASAEKQAAQIVDVVRALIEKSGWKFRIESAAQKHLDGK